MPDEQYRTLGPLRCLSKGLSDREDRYRAGPVVVCTIADGVVSYRTAACIGAVPDVILVGSDGDHLVLKNRITALPNGNNVLCLRSDPARGDL